MDSQDLLQILIIEDKPEVASLLKTLLESEFSASVETARDCTSAREMLGSATFDIITVDYQLPDGDGLELLREINSMDSPPPVVMITAKGDERTAADSIKLGVSGYVVKDQRVSTTLLETVRETLDRQTIKRALQESEEKYRTLYESSQDGISAVDLDGRIIECNSAFERMLGYTIDELKELPFLDITPEKWHGLNREIVQKVMEDGYSEPFEKEYIRKDGTVFPISILTWLIRDDRGNPAGMWSITRDITDRKRLEDKLLDTSEYAQDIVQTIREPLVVLDGKLRVISANRSFYSTFKVTTEASENTLLYDLGNGQWEIPRLRELLEEVLPKSTTVEDFEVEHDFPDIGQKTMLLNARRIPKPPGEIQMILLAIDDITERKQAEEALREMGERYKVVSDFTYDWEWWHAPDGKFLYISPSCERITGHTREEFLTEPDLLIRIVHPEDRMAVEKHIEETLSARETSSIDFRIVLPNGDIRWIGQRCQQVTDPSGNALGSRASNRDITERKKAEETLEHANTELEGYAHAVSHDLRGPVGAASLAFDMLSSAMEQGEVPREKVEKLKEIVEAGQSNTRNAHSIIENLLLLAEAGEPQDVSTVSIEETVNQVLADNAGDIEEKGVTIEVGLSLGQVVANPTQMYQVFSNLIRNSIKHNKAENPVIEISGPGVDGTTHRFLVRDNGQGIPEEVLDRVLIPFVKAQSSGTGIGLSTVEKIVRAYGGDIRAYNDNGACFEFTLQDRESEGTV